MKPITVIIVDDSALIRTLLSEMLADVPDITVLDTAVDPYDAREKIKRLNPDVITLDIEMPNMDGLSFLEKIMTLRPMPVIMISTLTQKGADETLRALELGAIDYISKPVQSQTRQTMAHLKDELAEKIRAAAKANLTSHQKMKNQEIAVLPFHPAPSMPYVIAMGSSTGGVEALRDIFMALPANCPPIVMTQHMPEQFTSSFANRLNGLSQVTVSEATHGAKLKPGHAYLARGNIHLKVANSNGALACKLEDGPAVSGHRPSVDVLFESVAETVGPNAVGVILTGMGKDGAQGMLKMKAQGAYTVGQNEASCVVYGMPKAAAALGAVQKELPLNKIAKDILTYCEQGRNNYAKTGN